MSETDNHTALMEHLLDLLGVFERVPDGNTLNKVVAAFVTRVPFENISKLYYKKRYGLRGLPELERYVEGIERYHFGGTCYSNNYCLHRLLKHLGFDVMLCGADMNNPDVHLVNMVTLDGREYLIDSGYAAPFLEPIPRDSEEEHVIVLGNSRYVLHPKDAEGRSRLELYRDGALTHAYTAKPIHRPIEYFSTVIADSFLDSSTFMNALLLARFWKGRAVILHNLTVIEAEGETQRVRKVECKGDLPAEIEKLFSIPRDIVAETIEGLQSFGGDAWS